MKTLKLFILLSLFSFKSIIAQKLVLETPKLKSPEEKLLYFLSDYYFFDLSNYKGDIKSASATYIKYKVDGKILSSKTEPLKSSKTLKILPKISKNPVLDNLNIDTVTKLKNGVFELYSFDKEYSYLHQVYRLKNNRIVQSIDNTSTLIYTTKYSYNKEGQLIKIETTDDYDNKEIHIAVYNKGNIISKESYKSGDGVEVVQYFYTYNKGKLVALKKQKARYIVTLEKENKELQAIDYSKYKNRNTTIDVNELKFLYNAKNELIVVNEIKKRISEAKGETVTDNRTFKLQHNPNKLIVLATLPEKRKYMYTFDTENNPKTIMSFVIDKKGTWLHREIKFDIIYNN